MNISIFSSFYVYTYIWGVYIYIYIYIYRERERERDGVMAIVVGNEHVDLSSNLGRDDLYVT